MATIVVTLEDKGVLNAFNRLQAAADFARIGTDVAYAAIYQFGSDIERAADGGTVRLRSNRRGELERNKARPKLAIFADHVTLKKYELLTKLVGWNGLLLAQVIFKSSPAPSRFIPALPALIATFSFIYLALGQLE